MPYIIPIRSDYAANHMIGPPSVIPAKAGIPESPISENTAALHEIGIRALSDVSQVCRGCQ